MKLMLKQLLTLIFLFSSAFLIPDAWAATWQVNPGDNVTAKIEFANEGDTLELAPGIYTAQNTAQYSDPNLSFGVGKRINIVGKGASPADVILRGTANTNYTVNFTQYTMPQPGGTPGAGLANLTPSGSLLRNLTIDTGKGGVSIFNPSLRFTDITLKDVVIKTKFDGDTFGVLVYNADRIVLDNVTVTSNQSGLYFVNATDSLVINSTVTGTGANASGTNVGAASLGVIGGSGNRFVGNTFGTAKASPATDADYSINTGNVVFYNSVANRFEGNVVQGHRDDGLDFSALNNPNDLGTMKSTDNYAAKNTVISTGYAAGRVAGSGVWSNCGADNTWLYANDSRGSAECGVCVWTSNSNMVLGNKLSDNRLMGVFVSGGAETPPLCPVASFVARPVNTFVRNNNVFFNRNDQLVVRNSDATDISMNFISPRNGFGGVFQACTNTFCQSAITLDTDNTASSSIGFLVAANISQENIRGIWSDSGKEEGVEIFTNRILGSTLNRFVQASTLNLDAGTNVGGNYWTQHTAFGNPSASNPFSGVFHDTSNNSGRVVDRFPYQSEDLGRGYSVAVFEPRAGLEVASGTSKTVRWYSPGCTYVDLTLGGTSLASNHPNTGYAVVSIPENAATGASAITVNCKSSAGVSLGSGNSPTFNIRTSDLKLMAPGRDDVFNAGETIFVAWKKTTSVSSVAVEFSSDGGASFSSLPFVAGGTLNHGRVTLPAGIASTAYAILRVSSGSDKQDATDGVFAVRSNSGAGFTNVLTGRKLIAGQMERLEWASPQGSRRASLSAIVNGATKVIATDLPDRGFFDWIVPEFGSVGTLNLSLTFKTSSGSQIGSVSTNAQGSVIYPTTITFGPTPSVTPGSSTGISATTNSGSAVAFTSRTPSVCSVTGNTTVTGLVSGNCIIDASAPGDASHSASLTSSLGFTVGSTQTITFNAPALVTVNGTMTLSASSSSSLTVAFRSLAGSVCAVSGNTVTGLAVGTCTVEASQAGNDTFSAATVVTRSFPSMVNTDIPRLVNIATRARVLTGDDVMIAGFIIGGDRPKQVLVRARGPSLGVPPFNVPGTIADPVLTLYSGPTPFDSNDDFGSHPNVGSIPSSLLPTSTKESAILTTLNPGAYTAIVTGAQSSTGVAIVEVFEINLPEVPLINIATRSKVQSGDDVMIAGLIIQGNAARTVLITARGPSMALPPHNVPGTLSNPYLRIYSGQTVIYENDDWGSNANAAAISATGNAPSDSRESAVLVTLPPGAYTAIVNGVGATSGIGIVEVFAQ